MVQINSHWPYLLEYARGEPSCLDRPSRPAGGISLKPPEPTIATSSSSSVIAAAASTAPAVVARALELDPDLGRHGPRVVLLTPGSLMPGIGLHRGAVKVHAIVGRVAVEPSILWIDVQARADILNFYNFDPVGGIGVDAGPRAAIRWSGTVRMRDMLAPEFFKKLTRSWFRMHYQFIMANDMRAPYEYMMLVCGPVPVEQWARRGRDILARLFQDATYTAPVTLEHRRSALRDRACAITRT